MIRLAALIAAFLVPLGVFADTTTEPAREATLVPQTVYVGDRARLIVPLNSKEIPSGRESFVVEQAELLPKTDAIHVHRLEVERRQDHVRVVIDFTAFAPGAVSFPTIDIEGLRLTGLEVGIASALDADATELSPPEKALTAPGTYVLIYGGIFLVVLATVGILFFVLRGVPLFKEYMERRRIGLAARSMRRVLGRLAADGGKMDGGTLLSVLFDELRSYLTYRTGRNCHALTAREFPLVLGDPSSSLRFSESDLAFLEALFRRGDEARFGSSPATYAELMDALRGVGEIVERTEAASC